jgi:hypothetical protein
MAASRKPAGAPGTASRATNRAAAQAALKRIAGYVEEPGSDGEGANPFVLSSSEGEGEEDGVVDRWDGRCASCSLPLALHYCRAVLKAASSDPSFLVTCLGVCRQYLKHRAHKLTNPRVRGRAASAVTSSPDTR